MAFKIGNIYLLLLTLLNCFSYADTVRFELFVSKKTIVVGEKFNFELRFTYPRDSFVRLRGINDPETKEIAGIEITGPTTEEKMHEGIAHKVLSWQGTCYAKEAGQLVIPPLKAHYSHYFYTYEISSEPITLTVQNLPVTKDRVSGIGRFKKYTIKLERSEMKAGEAQKLYVYAEGDGNFEKPEPIELHLPNGFKQYAGAQKRNGQIWQREFVIQPTQEGTYCIQAQDFVYYDTEKRKYQILSSKPLDLTVNKSDSIVTPVVTHLAKNKEPDGESDIPAKIKSLKLKQIYYIPWPLFLLFLLPPATILLFLVLQKKCAFYLRGHTQRYKWALRRARKQLQRAQKEQNAKALYAIIKTACIDRYKLLPAKSESTIEEMLNQMGYSSEFIEQWKAFTAAVLAPEFSNKNNTPTDKTILFEQAYHILNKLEKAL